MRLARVDRAAGAAGSRLSAPGASRRALFPASLFLAAASCVAAPVPEQAAFSPWFSSRGIQVEIARSPSSPPWIRGLGTIPAPAARVAAALSDFGRYLELFAPAVRKADVLGREPGSARIHFVWPYPFPFANRDAVVRYETSDLPGGAFRIAWNADARPEDPKEGRRIERVEGETRIEPAGPDACRVTYTYLGDLGGKFPASAQEKAWREEPVQYFRAILRRLGLPDLRKDGA